MKESLGFDKYLVAILASLFERRDGVSRIADESSQYLARGAWLFIVARAKSSARTPEGLLRVLDLADIKARFIEKYHVDLVKTTADTLDSNVPPLPGTDYPKEDTGELTPNAEDRLRVPQITHLLSNKDTLFDLN